MSKPKNWDQAAYVIWPELTRAAEKHPTLTYGELAPLIPTNPLSVGLALGPIQAYCMEQKLPPLTALVVGKTTGVPGNGFVAWDVDDLDEGLNAVFHYPWGTKTNPFAGFADGQTEAEFVGQLLSNPDEAGDAYSKIKNRGIAQRIFRKALLEAYERRCCMCANSFETALEAAHIKSWGDCDKSERLDVRNGLLLCCNHHRMFDRGQITIRIDYHIEYCDPRGLDGPYSAIDKMLSIDLHDQRIQLPEKIALFPSTDAIAARRKQDEWD